MCLWNRAGELLSTLLPWDHCKEGLWAQTPKIVFPCAFLWRDLDQLGAKHHRKFHKSGGKRLFKDFLFLYLVYYTEQFLRIGNL